MMGSNLTQLRKVSGPFPLDSCAIAIIWIDGQSHVGALLMAERSSRPERRAGRNGSLLGWKHAHEAHTHLMLSGIRVDGGLLLLQELCLLLLSTIALLLHHVLHKLILHELKLHL